MNPITPIPGQSEPAAVPKMRALVDTLESELTHLASVHQNLFNKLWNDPDSTPAENLAALGDRAGNVMALATLNVQNIAAMAPLFNKTLADYLQPEDYTPPLAFTVHDDGTVTLD